FAAGGRMQRMHAQVVAVQPPCQLAHGLRRTVIEMRPGAKDLELRDARLLDFVEQSGAQPLAAEQVCRKNAHASHGPAATGQNDRLRAGCSGRTAGPGWELYYGRAESVLDAQRRDLDNWLRPAPMSIRVRVCQISTTRSRCRLLSPRRDEMERSRVASLPLLWMTSPSRYASVTCWCPFRCPPQILIASPKLI